MKLIKINVEAKTLVPFKDLVVVQGNLKELNKTNFDKLKKSILKYGITAAWNVWTNPDGKYEILDGTQRHRVLTLLLEEGYECSHVPVNFVQASSKEEAMNILLTHASQYGTPDYDGFYNFITDCNLDPTELSELTTFDNFLNFNTENNDIEIQGIDGKFEYKIVCNNAEELGNLRLKFDTINNKCSYEKFNSII